MSIYDQIRHERERAHAKHGPNSMENGSCLDPTGRRFRILLEEVGEVAKEFNDAEIDARPVDAGLLKKELVQVAAMAAAWADALDYYLTPDVLCIECGRDNRNGTHSALERTGHLSHHFTPGPIATEDTDLHPADAQEPIYEAETPRAREIPESTREAIRSAMAEGFDAVLDVMVKIDQNARGWGLAHGQALAEVSESLKNLRDIRFTVRGEDLVAVLDRNAKRRGR